VNLVALVDFVSLHLSNKIVLPLKRKKLWGIDLRLHACGYLVLLFTCTVIYFLTCILPHLVEYLDNTFLVKPKLKRT
jgi:hypothetical protein